MNSLSRKVNEALEAETRRAERLQDAAYRDQVTGLLNARGFAARFESLYEGENAPFAGVLAFVELVELAAINRRLGTERCDALLREVLRRDAGGRGAPRAASPRAGAGALTVLALPRAARRTPRARASPRCAARRARR